MKYIIYINSFTCFFFHLHVKYSFPCIRFYLYYTNIVNFFRKINMIIYYFYCIIVYFKIHLFTCQIMLIPVYKLCISYINIVKLFFLQKMNISIYFSTILIHIIKILVNSIRNRTNKIFSMWSKQTSNQNNGINN
jgi:hypothetical protein